MRETEQTSGQTILQHGESVWSYTEKLINKNFDNFILPDWFIENIDSILSNIHDIDDIKEYNIFHDCGKPFCRYVDEFGKVHFPSHDQISKITYESFSDNKIVANLIGLDMVLHTYTVEQIQSLNLSPKDANTLILTAIAELHSNANMFGGTDSTSFKIKYKKTIKNCAKIKFYPN